MPGIRWRDERSSSDPLDELPVLSGLQIVVVLAHVLGLAQHGVAGAGEVVAVLDAIVTEAAPREGAHPEG